MLDMQVCRGVISQKEMYSACLGVALMLASHRNLPTQHTHLQHCSLELQLCTIAVALHCLGVPADWRGEPGQSAMLLAEFVKFLKGLAGAPLLEAAQGEVNCCSCGVSLDIAAWLVRNGPVQPTTFPAKLTANMHGTLHACVCLDSSLPSLASWWCTTGHLAMPHKLPLPLHSRAPTTVKSVAEPAAPVELHQSWCESDATLVNWLTCSRPFNMWLCAHRQTMSSPCQR